MINPNKQIKINGISIGDYVLATKWRDKHSKDPWCVGFVIKIIITADNIEYMINYDPMEYIYSSNVPYLTLFKYVKKIKKEQGDYLIKNLNLICNTHRTLHYWLSTQKREAAAYEFEKGFIK